MKGRIFGAIAVAALVATGQPISGEQAGKGPAGGGRWTVVFRTATLPADAADRVAASGGRVERSVTEIGVLTASGDEAFAAKLARDRDVLAVGPEKMYSLPPVVTKDVESDVEALGAPTTADSLYGYQWNVRRIAAPAMWARVPLEVQAASTVAILDTGVMHTHSDLDAQVVAATATNYCNESYAGSDAYPVYSRLIDLDAHPVWTPSMGCDTVDTVYHSHGTHVAGIVAAEFGNGRVVGVAPGVRIAAYKVFDRYRFTRNGAVVDDVGAFDGPVLAAIVHASLAGHKVINLSLGGTIDRSDKGDNASWLAWDRAAKLADKMGVTIVAAGGNAAENSNGSLAHLPSDLPTVISVSATGTSNLVAPAGMLQAAPGSDVLAFYSNYGAAKDIAAPGGDCGPEYDGTNQSPCVGNYFILSTYIFEDDGAPGYAWMIGTSMSAPHVAAVAAVTRALHPEWTPGEVRAWLKETADPIGSRQAFGHGMLNADKATK